MRELYRREALQRKLLYNQVCAVINTHFRFRFVVHVTAAAAAATTLVFWTRKAGPRKSL